MHIISNAEWHSIDNAFICTLAIDHIFSQFKPFIATTVKASNAVDASLMAATIYN